MTILRTSSIRWIVAVLMLAVQLAPVPGSAFTVTVLLRIPAVRAFLPPLALQVIGALDMVELAIRARRWVGGRLAGNA